MARSPQLIWRSAARPWIISNINDLAAEVVASGLKERGVFAVATTADIDANLLARVLRVNVSGILLGAKQGTAQVLARGGGVIIKTSAGTSSQGNWSVRCTAHGKRPSLTWPATSPPNTASRRIRSIDITPSVILSPAVAATIPPEAQASVTRHPLPPRGGRPKDIARLVASLVSNETSFISGVAIAVDGDLTLHFPTYAEELDARARSLAVMDMQR